MHWIDKKTGMMLQQDDDVQDKIDEILEEYPGQVEKIIKVHVELDDCDCQDDDCDCQDDGCDCQDDDCDCPEVSS